MKHILSWSGGKDSTASVILAHENGLPLDLIVFVEVMYDNKRGISGENPKHMDFVCNVAKPMFESWGYKVLIIRGDIDYLTNFNRIIKYARKHPEHIGKRFGFPIAGLCGVKRDCKLRPMSELLRSIGPDYVEYVGICIDEPRRLRSLHMDKHKVSILEKFGYTEDMAAELCKEYGLYSYGYELSKRGGCWFCPFAKLEEHRYICQNMPEVWSEFVGLEKSGDLAFDHWNLFSTTLQERTLLLKNENRNNKE